MLPMHSTPLPTIVPAVAPRRARSRWLAVPHHWHDHDGRRSRPLDGVLDMSACQDVGLGVRQRLGLAMWCCQDGLAALQRRYRRGVAPSRWLQVGRIRQHDPDSDAARAWRPGHGLAAASCATAR